MLPENKGHSRVGASSMYRWKACPGSVKLCAQMPEQKSSAYAEEGTKAHELAEFRLNKGYYPKDADVETIDAVDVYVSYIESITKKLVPHKLSRVHTEFKFSHPTIHEGFRGTADSVIYDGNTKTLYVTDYKHGQGIPVSPVNNLQLCYYGIGSLLAMGDAPVSKVILTIVQPRFSLDTAVKSWEIEPEALLEFKYDLMEAIRETEKHNAKVVTGDHCHFCTAKPICPVLKNEASIAVKEEFALASLNKLDSKTVAGLLNKLDVIETWCKGVREFAYQEAKAGRIPEGYKLVPKRAMRKWADANEALKKLENTVSPNVVRELLTEPELKSPAQVEKIIGGKAGKEMVEPLTISVSSGDTLVSESDDRQPTDKKTLAKLMFS